MLENFSGIWYYRTVITQTNVAAQNLRLTIVADGNDEFTIQSITIGPDDYAAGRTVTISVTDTSSAVLATLNSQSIDNQKIYAPVPGSASANGLISLPAIHTIAGNDELRIDAAALAQNETITIQIRAKLSGLKPIATASGTGNSPAVTYDKVV